MKQIRALLVHDQAAHMSELESILSRAGVAVHAVHSIPKLRQELGGKAAPDVVFVDMQCPGNHWQDALRDVRAVGSPAAVIVVAETADVRLHMDVIESGAFDFLAAPFCAADVSHLTRQAARRAGTRHKRPTAADPKPRVATVHMA